MSGIVLLLYLFLILVFIGGLIVIVYHLLTFRLNRALAWFMVTLLLVGGFIILVVNLFYFSRIDWQKFFENFNF